MESGIITGELALVVALTAVEEEIKAHEVKIGGGSETPLAWKDVAVARRAGPLLGATARVGSYAQTCIRSQE